MTMRLQERRLNSEVLGNAVATYEVIEEYAGQVKHNRHEFSMDKIGG